MESIKLWRILNKGKFQNNLQNLAFHKIFPTSKNTMNNVILFFNKK